MSSVRDRERLRQAPRTLAGRRVAIGEEGGLDAAVAALRRLLVSHGALVITHHHPDGSIQASEANAGGADVYLGLRLDAGAAHVLDRLLRRLPLRLPRWPAAGRAPPGDARHLRSAFPTAGAGACPCPSSGRPGCRR